MCWNCLLNIYEFIVRTFPPKETIIASLHLLNLTSKLTSADSLIDSFNMRKIFFDISITLKNEATVGFLTSEQRSDSQTPDWWFQTKFSSDLPFHDRSEGKYTQSFFIHSEGPIFLQKSIDWTQSIMCVGCVLQQCMTKGKSQVMYRHHVPPPRDFSQTYHHQSLSTLKLNFNFTWTCFLCFGLFPVSHL